MGKRTNYTHDRGYHRHGSMAILVLIALSGLLGMTAFAVDSGFLTLSKTTLRAAADAAALAAAGTMTQTDDLDLARNTALEYAHDNVPDSYGEVLVGDDVVFGQWDSDSHTFTPTNSEVNAVKITLVRSFARGNPIGRFFALGNQGTEMQTEAIAVGALTTNNATYHQQVYVTSSKNLSNVVLEFDDGAHQKFEGLCGYSGTFQGTGTHSGKEVVGVWIKSGCNKSGDGPGYGERIDNPGDGSVVHGDNQHWRCKPHVTATFEATGVDFNESGFVGPVRLVH